MKKATKSETTPTSATTATATATGGDAATWTHLDEIEPWVKNPRKNDHKIPEAIGSLRRWGFATPMVVWTSRRQLVGGHLRLKSMRRILAEDPNLDGQGGTNADLARRNAKLRKSLCGPTFAHVPVRFVEFESPEEAAAYALRDNNALGEWDDAGLAEVIADIASGGASVSGLGWEDAELRKIMGQIEQAPPDPGADPGTPAPDQTGRIEGGFSVIVDCDDEKHQLAVIERFQAEGFRNVRALAS